MKTKKLLFKTVLTLMILSSFAVAGPAFHGTRIFTQPDGTKFEGNLKGDSSFNWIESNGNVVIINPEDKFYYNAVIGVDDSLQLTNQKPAIKADGVFQSNGITPKKHDVSADERKKLHNLYKKSKTGNHPR